MEKIGLQATNLKNLGSIFPENTHSVRYMYSSSFGIILADYNVTSFPCVDANAIKKRQI